MRAVWSYEQLIAAILSVVLLLVPVLLVGIPRYTQNGFPGPYTRADAIIAFFVIVPLLFASLAAYHVAKYHGLVGTEDL